MKQTSVIVIGAGIAGITAAIHLIKAGLHVTVFEKNARPGGRCDRLSHEGHHFDTGPTPIGWYRRIFQQIHSWVHYGLVSRALL